MPAEAWEKPKEFREDPERCKGGGGQLAGRWPGVACGVEFVILFLVPQGIVPLAICIDLIKNCTNRLDPEAKTPLAALGSRSMPGAASVGVCHRCPLLDAFAETDTLEADGCAGLADQEFRCKGGGGGRGW